MTLLSAPLVIGKPPLNDVAVNVPVDGLYVTPLLVSE